MFCSTGPVPIRVWAIRSGEVHDDRTVNSREEAVFEVRCSMRLPVAWSPVGDGSGTLAMTSAPSLRSTETSCTPALKHPRLPYE